MPDKENFYKQKKVFKQYFTPNRITEFALDFAREIEVGFKREKVFFVDPACGDGAFIKAALEKNITEPGKFTGIDKDESLKEKWQKDGLYDYDSNTMITGDGLFHDLPGKFRIAAGNPPFGIIRLDHQKMNIFNRFDLFRIYTKNGQRENINAFQIEVLFLERFMQILENGGLAAIVLPVGIISNMNMKYIREWLLDNFSVNAVITIKNKIFMKTGASAYTVLLFIQKRKSGADDLVFQASASQVNLEGECGDHLDDILKAYKNRESFNGNGVIAFFTPVGELGPDNWDPHYNNPDYKKYFDGIKKSRFSSAPLNEVVESGSIFTGYKGIQPETSKSGKIPYISSKNITPAGIDLSKNASYIDFESLANPPRTRLREGDILLVRSGEGCIGRVTIACKEDIGANIRSEIYVLRANPERINPFYLAVYFNCFLKPFGKKRRNGRIHKAHFQMCRLASGVGTPNLNKQEILSLIIPLIPVDVQGKIEKKYKKILRNFRKDPENRCKAQSLMEKLTRSLENYITGGDFV